MIIITSLLAIGIVLIPIRKIINIHPRYRVIWSVVYWGVDVLRGCLLTILAYVMSGWSAAYFAALLAVMLGFFLRECYTIAVAVGAIIVFSPLLLLVSIVIFLLSFVFTRYVVVATYFTIIAIVLFGAFLTAQFLAWGTIVVLAVIIGLEYYPAFRRVFNGGQKQIDW
jgi:glycerol-3-phosphate acyltransferase PlsY